MEVHFSPERHLVFGQSPHTTILFLQGDWTAKTGTGAFSKQYSPNVWHLGLQIQDLAQNTERAKIKKNTPQNRKGVPQNKAQTHGVTLPQTEMEGLERL